MKVLYGIGLPVAWSDSGYEVVPLKPLCESFGMEWEGQLAKVKSEYWRDFYGACIATVHHGGQNRAMLCIRIDRVDSWMFKLNPAHVRAMGFDERADLLIAMHERWANAIHEAMVRNNDPIGTE